MKVDAIKEIEIDRLIPYPNNARTHSDDQVAQIAASIKEFGFTNPVLVDGDNGIIAGHGRVQAARKLQLKSVPTIDLSYLTPVQRKAYILADNKLSLNAGWDVELLQGELAGLDALEFDLSLTGFSDSELAGFLDANEGLTDPDDVPDVPDEPVTKPGDIYTLGNHRLMCGDSTSVDAMDKLMAGQKADMIFTDPPYGVNYDGGSKKRDKLIDDHVGTDIYTDSVPIMAMYCTGPIYTWYADTKPRAYITQLKP